MQKNNFAKQIFFHFPAVGCANPCANAKCTFTVNRSSLYSSQCHKKFSQLGSIHADIEKISDFILKCSLNHNAIKFDLLTFDYSI